MKTAIIIRHASGAGGSSLAKTLYQISEDCVICEADNYFYDEDGNYIFDPSQLGKAHARCQKLFIDSLEMGIKLVICSNTNTTKKEYQFYVDKAIEAGYNVHVVVVERFLETKSIHNVPDDVVNKQIQRLRSSIQL